MYLYCCFFQYKIVVFRPEKVEMSTVDIELTKKPGKGLGLSLMAMKSGDKIFVSEIVSEPKHKQ